MFIIKSQGVDLLFVLRDSLQQSTIDALPMQELSNNLLNIGVAGGRSDALESLLVLLVLFHFFFHLGFQKCTPELLS